YLRLANLKKFAPGDPDIAAMETVLTRLPTSDGRTIPFCFALGKAYEDCEDYDRAFNYYTRGNKLKRAELAFDIVETFSKPFLKKEADRGFDSEVPIFILGMPRSGTSLVEQILASHSEVHGGGERAEWMRLVRGIDSFPDGVRDFGPEDFARLGENYVEALRKLAPEAARITDKLPHNFLHVGLIHLALPKAKILHCVRNPVDTCLSCYKHLFDSELSFAYDLDELGRYYRLYERLMHHWRAVLPGRMLDVPYEELVADQETLSRRILDFCELPWEPACLDFHKTDRRVQTASVAQVRQPIYTTAVRRWRKYEHRIAPLLAALA
ncbi:MAG: sulfotransferase family protein, partial [Alphaproteobacteria bacterium]